MQQGAANLTLKVGIAVRACYSLTALFVCGLSLFGWHHQALGQAFQATKAADLRSDLSDALSTSDWRRVDQSVDRALVWLAEQQNPDGSFPTVTTGQPAITSLCTMAFLSGGEQPGVGAYGERLNRAIDFVLDCQLPSGLLSYSSPEPQHVHQGASHTATYNHAIAGLMLTEAYGQVDRERSARIAEAVNQAIRLTARLQVEPVKDSDVDEGGWRYLHKPGSFTPSDSDLSVTGWYLMFLRSAKNAQFDVPDGQRCRAIRRTLL
jgi:hypothetical protein